MILSKEARKARSIQNALYGAGVRVGDYSHVAGQYATFLEKGEDAIAEATRQNLKKGVKELKEYLAALEDQI
jgi:enamine deaminase RidA (YjgF/YER057c/UK114 family)